MKHHLSDLDNPGSIREHDGEGLFTHIDGLGAQLMQGERLGTSARLDGLEGPDSQIRQIVFCGMGGSAIAGDLAVDLLEHRLSVPLQVNRRYRLPVTDAASLVLISSYSGNTAETLSCFEEARETGRRLIAVTTGGLLREAAQRAGVPVILLPPGLPPRCSLGLSCGALLTLLARLGLTEQVRVRDWIPFIEKESKSLSPDVSTETNPAKQLALRLQHTIPVIYAADGRLGATARRWASQLAENGKQLGWFSLLPEMNHNEIVGWKHPKQLLAQLTAIFLHDRDDHPEVARRLHLTAEMISRTGASTFHVESSGASWPERLWSLVLLGDYASAYAGVLNQEDPSPVMAIEELKQKLRKESSNDNKS